MHNMKPRTLRPTGFPLDGNLSDWELMCFFFPFFFFPPFDVVHCGCRIFKWWWYAFLISCLRRHRYYQMCTNSWIVESWTWTFFWPRTCHGTDILKTICDIWGFGKALLSRVWYMWRRSATGIQPFHTLYLRSAQRLQHTSLQSPILPNVPSNIHPSEGRRTAFPYPMSRLPRRSAEWFEQCVYLTSDAARFMILTFFCWQNSLGTRYHRSTKTLIGRLEEAVAAPDRNSRRYSNMPQVKPNCRTRRDNNIICFSAVKNQCISTARTTSKTRRWYAHYPDAVIDSAGTATSQLAGVFGWSGVFLGVASQAFTSVPIPLPSLTGLWFRTDGNTAQVLFLLYFRLILLHLNGHIEQGVGHQLRSVPGVIIWMWAAYQVIVLFWWTQWSIIVSGLQRVSPLPVYLLSLKVFSDVSCSKNILLWVWQTNNNTWLLLIISL